MLTSHRDPQSSSPQLVLLLANNLVNTSFRCAHLLNCFNVTFAQPLFISTIPKQSASLFKVKAFCLPLPPRTEVAILIIMEIQSDWREKFGGEISVRLRIPIIAMSSAWEHLASFPVLDTSCSSTWTPAVWLRPQLAP